MKLKHIVIAMAAASIMTLTSLSMAADGPYVRVLGGLGFVNKWNLNFTGANTNIKFKTGYDFAGNVGYNSGPLSYEVELGYVHAKAKNVNQANTDLSNESGRSALTVGMANVIYNFQDMNPNVIPYVGVGIGFGRLSQSIDATGMTTATVSGTKFAYQGILGVNYKLNMNWKVGVDYRYLATSKFKFSAANQTVKEKFSSNNLNLSLMYDF